MEGTEAFIFFQLFCSPGRPGAHYGAYTSLELASKKRSQSVFKSHYCHYLGLKDVWITKEKAVPIGSVQQSASPHTRKRNRVKSVATKSPFEPSFLVPKYNFLVLKTPNLSACLLYLRLLQTSGAMYQQYFSRRHCLFQENSSPLCSYSGSFFSNSLQRQPAFLSCSDSPVPT